MQNVFQDASLAWFKRQSSLSARRAAATATGPGPGSASPLSGWWNNVVPFEVQPVPGGRRFFRLFFIVFLRLFLFFRGVDLRSESGQCRHKSVAGRRQGTGFRGFRLPLK